MKKKQALIIENPQIDYFEGGALDIPNANRIIPILNQLIPQFETVIVTLDWHPANHISFAANHPWRQIGQIIEVDQTPIELKPIHCVQDTFGAKIHPHIQEQNRLIPITKGDSIKTEDHSAFYNKGNAPTKLLPLLKEKKIEELFLAGMILEDNLLNTLLEGLAFYPIRLFKNASIGRVDTLISPKLYKYIQQQGINIL